MSGFFIIESNTLGTLKSVEYWPFITPYTPSPHYSVTGPRSDAMKFRTLDDAKAMVASIVDGKARGWKNVCIRRSDDYKAFCTECFNWCDYWHEHKKTCSVYRDEIARHNR